VRLAIISDIHSNLEALTKALELIQSQEVDQTICLGDIVGYGANPNECIELVRHHCSVVLMGNHDAAALDPSVATHFTPHARIAVKWTAAALTHTSQTYLKTLPLTGRLPEILFVHASPYEPEEWHYVLSSIDAQPALNALSEKICFIGHTHVPAIYTHNGRVSQVEKWSKALVNVGSVGQPRDGIPLLSYGVFDTEHWSYENIRSEYDVETASEKILKAGLPRVLAERLLVGM
jgi:predicted phosphodiesterase